MKIELFIASKYLKNRKGNLFISTMSIISIAMVVLFVAVPILTSSVANGFQLNILDKVLTYDYHITLFDSSRTFINFDEISKALKEINEVKSVHPYFEEKALIKRFGSNYLSNLRGVNINDINKNSFGKNFNKIAGDLKINDNKEIILGESLAANLFVRPGDSINIAVIDPSEGTRAFNTLTFTVKGVFSAGYARYDSFLAYTSLNSMRELNRANPKLITSIGIYLKNQEESEKISNLLKNDIRFKKFEIINSERMDIFKEFQKEKKLISIILYVAVLLSFLNIYITLNVIVVEKQKEIGIMKAFGVKGISIQMIFVFEGLLIGLIGTFIGIILGLFLTVNIKEISQGIELLVNSLNKVWAYAFNLPTPEPFEIMPQEKFYLTTLPYKINFIDIFLQGIGALLSALFAAYLPSRRAALKRPVEVLRYE